MGSSSSRQQTRNNVASDTYNTGPAAANRKRYLLQAKEFTNDPDSISLLALKFQESDSEREKVKNDLINEHKAKMSFLKKNLSSMTQR